MRHQTPASSIAQAAAFALFESLRGADAVTLDRLGECRVTCLGQVDPAVSGLAFTNTGDAALRMRLDGAPEGLDGTAWLHAACDDRGPVLSVYLTPERPALQLRFGPPALLALEDMRFLLRERLNFPSHDGHQEFRKEFAATLARQSAVPLVGGWLHIGTWDALNASWQPESGRRLMATALLIEQARLEYFF